MFILPLSLAPFLYIYFPKLTQSAFISCLLGYIFAFSLPFLPIHYCIPSTLPLHIPFYRSCLPAMPWGLESCRMRCRWGKINWSIATHNERRRKSIQRMNHPPPPPPTILFSRSSGTGERTVMCCVRLYEVLWGRKGKCLCRIRFFTVPDKTCILQGKNNNTLLAKEGGEKVECSVMVIGSINALKSIPLSISTIITGPVRHSVSPGFIFYRSHCQDHFTCPLSECPIKIFNSLLLQLALLQFPFSHSLSASSCKNCLSTS